MPDQTATVAGRVALFTAEVLGRRVSKYQDPIDGAEADLDYAAARRVLEQDPGLIYLHVKVSDGDLAERIRELRDAAAASDDGERVALCDDALIGKSGALAECLSILLEECLSILRADADD